MNEDCTVCLDNCFESFTTYFHFVLLMRVTKFQKVSEKYCTLDETDTTAYQEGTAWKMICSSIHLYITQVKR